MSARSSKTRPGSSKSYTVTPEEREQKHKEQRERVEAACRQLLTSDGWRRWVRIRSTNGLSRYSRHNQFLLGLQAMERNIELTYVTGFKAFKRLGYAVRKGEKALWVLAPRTIVVKDDENLTRSGSARIATQHPKAPAGRGAVSTENGEVGGVRKRVYFRAVPVFDLSQTDETPDAEVVDLTPPSQPVDGDSHAHLIEPLRQHAAELGYEVEEIRLDPNGPGGWCDHKAKKIVVGAGAANRVVRVLVHELAHAHGVTYKEYSRKQAEVIVDTVTHIVLSNAHLDVSGETLPYITGWGEADGLEAITRYAEVIDEVATALEDAILPQPEEEAPDTKLTSADEALAGLAFAA